MSKDQFTMVFGFLVAPVLLLPTAASGQLVTCPCSPFHDSLCLVGASTFQPCLANSGEPGGCECEESIGYCTHAFYYTASGLRLPKLQVPSGQAPECNTVSCPGTCYYWLEIECWVQMSCLSDYPGNNQKCDRDFPCSQIPDGMETEWGYWESTMKCCYIQQ